MTYIYKLELILNSGKVLKGQIRTQLETSHEVLTALLGEKGMTHQTILSMDGRKTICVKIDDVSAVIVG